MTGGSKSFRIHLTDEDLLQKLRCAEGLRARLAVDSEKIQDRAEVLAAENGIAVDIIIRASARRIG